MDVFNIIRSIAVLYIVFARFTFDQAFEGFSFRKPYKIVDLLINRHYGLFQDELRKHFSGPEGDFLSDKNSYEIGMHEVLMTLSPQFVVIESVLTDHVLIPQCRSPKSRAFLIQYRVLDDSDLSSSVPLHILLECEADHALTDIEENEKAMEFVSGFLHVKEVVKIGLAFYNRNNTAFVHKIEYVNVPKKNYAIYSIEHEYY